MNLRIISMINFELYCVNQMLMLKSSLRLLDGMYKKFDRDCASFELRNLSESFGTVMHALCPERFHGG